MARIKCTIRVDANKTPSTTLPVEVVRVPGTSPIPPAPPEGARAARTRPREPQPEEEDQGAGAAAPEPRMRKQRRAAPQSESSRHAQEDPEPSAAPRYGRGKNPALSDRQRQRASPPEDQDEEETDLTVTFEKAVVYPDIRPYLRPVRIGSGKVDTTGLNEMTWLPIDPNSMARSGVDTIQFIVRDKGGMGAGGAGA